MSGTKHTKGENKISFFRPSYFDIYGVLGLFFGHQY